MTDLLRFTAGASIDLTAAGDTKPKRPMVAILAYTGAEMVISGRGPTAVDLQGMELPSSVPVLLDHRNETDSLAAQGEPRVDGKQLTVNGPLAVGTPAGDRVIALAKSGVNLAASIGAEVLQSRRLKPGEQVGLNGRLLTAGEAGLLLVEKSRLREVSLTPIGADSQTTVNVAASKKGTSEMEITSPVTTPAADIQAAVTAERQRLAEIDKITTGLHLTGALSAQADQLRGKAVAGEISLDALRAGCLDLLRASRTTPTIGLGYHAGQAGSGTAKHLAAALMVKAGHAKAAESVYGATVMEQSKTLHARSLPDLCRAALEIDGRECPESRDGMIRAALSTGSMPVALGDSANKVLQMTYAQAPASWRQVAAVKSSPNFKTQTALRPTFAGNLEQLAPGGEVKHGQWGEETYTWAIDTFAKLYGFDRRDVINDDLSALAEVVPSLAKAAARGVSDLVYSTLLDGAAAQFTTGRANYQEGAGTPLSSTSLAAAIKLLRQMKDADGNLLDLAPAVLLVPPELEFTAKALVQSSEVQRYTSSTVDLVPMGNAFQDICQVAIEPRLSDTSYSGYSAVAWYLFSAPANSALCVAFLNGLESPVIETFGFDAQVDTLAMSYRCYHDYGACLGDYRAAIRSKGSA